MTTVTVQEAQLRLAELLKGLTPGEDIVLTDDNRPVARIVSATPVSPTTTRKLGFLRGSVKLMSDDFSAPLDDMKDYM